MFGEIFLLDFIVFQPKGSRLLVISLDRLLYFFYHFVKTEENTFIMTL
jgi:hypothetical protein